MVRTLCACTPMECSRFRGVRPRRAVHTQCRVFWSPSRAFYTQCRVDVPPVGAFPTTPLRSHVTTPNVRTTSRSHSTSVQTRDGFVTATLALRHLLHQLAYSHTRTQSPPFSPRQRAESSETLTTVSQGLKKAPFSGSGGPSRKQKYSTQKLQGRRMYGGHSQQSIFQWLGPQSRPKPTKMQTPSAHSNE